MRPPPPLAAQPPVSRPPDQGATANVETTTITTPEGSVSASGWFSWPKFCPSYLLRLFGILALLCLGTAFALSSYSATSALLSSQWHESPTSFPAVTTPIAPASLNGFCEIGGDDTSSFAAIASSDSVPADHPVLARSRLLVLAPRQLVTHSPRAVQGGRDEGRLLEGLLEDVKEAVGEPLRVLKVDFALSVYYIKHAILYCTRKIFYLRSIKCLKKLCHKNKQHSTICLTA